MSMSLGVECEKSSKTRKKNKKKKRKSQKWLLLKNTDKDLKRYLNKG